MDDALIFGLRPSGEWESIAWKQFFEFKSETDRLPNWQGDVFIMAVVLSDDGSVANMIPHRYRFDDSGRRLPGDVGPLTNDENSELNRLCLLRNHTESEKARLQSLNEKVWEWCLPKQDEIRSLIRMLGRDIDSSGGVTHMLAAIGIDTTNWRRSKIH